MAGIADLTNIMMAGGRPDVPMPPPQGAGAPMGGPPPGPPMGAPGMGEMAAAGAPPMGEMPMEQEGISIEEDSMALAEAVVGRAQGDVATAVAILDTAKQLLMSSAENAPVPAKDGRYLYRENGGTISDTDVLRQMIMEDLQNPEILEQGLAEAMAKLHGQTGRAVSDKDIEFHKTMLGSADDETLANIVNKHYGSALREQADYERFQTRLEELQQDKSKLTGGVPTSGLPVDEIMANKALIESILHGQTGRAVSDKDKTIDFANRVIDTIDDEIKARDKAMSDVMKFKML